MKYYILFNEKAGNGQSELRARALADSYEGEIVYMDILKIDDYSSFVSALTPADIVVLFGGDGTLNRFVNNLEGLTLPCDVLYCATGSGNDFHNDINKNCLDGPLQINKYLVDLPSVEVKGVTYRFLNGVGYGIDGYCCEVGDAMKAKKPTKSVNYTSIAIKGLLFHYKPTSAKVCVDGEEFSYKKVWIAPTMSGRFYGGGMMAAPKQARRNPDRTLSLVVLHGTGKLKTLMIFPSIFKGEHIKDEKHVAVHVGKEITVTFDRPVALQIDGETILGVTSYTARSNLLDAKIAEQEAATV